MSQKKVRTFKRLGNVGVEQLLILKVWPTNNSISIAVKLLEMRILIPSLRSSESETSG